MGSGAGRKRRVGSAVSGTGVGQSHAFPSSISKEEMEKLVAAISASGRPLILYGAPGTGKTSSVKGAKKAHGFGVRYDTSKKLIYVPESMAAAFNRQRIPGFDDGFRTVAVPDALLQVDDVEQVTF